MTLVVVGVGEDGWDGMAPSAREAVLGSDRLICGRRVKALLGEAVAGLPHSELPSPLAPFLDELASRGGEGERICVVASGDPMLHGVGSSLARRTQGRHLEVHPHVSSFSLACARLGWPAAEVTLLSTVVQPPEILAAALQPDRRLIVLVPGAGGAAAVARVLTERGFGASRIVVLERLGGPAERSVEGTAAHWGDRQADPLHVVAVEVRADPGTEPLPATPGLPDGAFEHDGQLTKRHVRAVTLAMLAPMPARLLWDVGAGSGSIAIEWLRAGGGRALAVEADPARAERIARNAARLGAPGLEVVTGTAPAVLAELPPPGAVFIGGGLTDAGVLDACLAGLSPGGVLVANAVTLESEAVLAGARAAHGGTLTRIEVAHAEPVGGLTGWRAKMPVTQWVLAR